MDCDCWMSPDGGIRHDLWNRPIARAVQLLEDGEGLRVVQQLVGTMRLQVWCRLWRRYQEMRSRPHDNT